MRALAAGLATFLFALAAHAEPLARDDVPEPLRAWVDWVLRGHEHETCPALEASGARACVWPGRLSLALDANGGSFEQEVYVAIETEIALPGGGNGAWPEDVRVGGTEAGVIERGASPAVRLPRGRHTLSGRFVWSAMPPGLRIPVETGIVDLTLNGQRAARPRRDADGSLWLRDAAASPAARPAENRVDVEVHRRLADGVPPRLSTVITVRASGEAREELLGVALPSGMTPTALASPLPARLDASGRLRVQVRPGEWTIRIEARLAARSEAFGPPKQPSGARWDGTEVWAVALAPQLRLVEIEGAPAIDPTQTEMPAEWRELPAYRLDPGAALTFVEKRRGSEGAAADQLALSRTWHLDFDGAGATVSDEISGTLRSSLRLEMGEATALGRAAIDGQDQPITQRSGSEQLGIETTLGALALEADSRVEGGVRTLPAVGWAHDFDSVSATPMIPPGYRLFHATGVDAADTTWISSWDLLSVFFVLLAGVAIWRLFGTAPAALALAALALRWPESGAPKLIWLALAVLEALRRVARHGRIGRAVSLAHLAGLVALVVITVPFAIRQVRIGLFPALERPWESAGVMQDESLANIAMPSAPPEEMMAAAADAAGAAESIVVTARKRASSIQDIPGSMSESDGDYDSYSKSNFAPDPSVTVPTGPGRPGLDLGGRFARLERARSRANSNSACG